MTYLADRPSPLLARRGGRDIKRNIAKLPLMERTGWWVRIQRRTTPPVCAASDVFCVFLLGAATPPGQEGRWPGPPSMLLPPHGSVPLTKL